jgi:hypothetical protein
MAMPASVRCRRANSASIASWRVRSQSIAAYTSAGDASATPRSVPRVTSPHQTNVDSFGLGRTTRDTISARVRSRSRPAGPSMAGKSSFCAIACTAATCPCGRLRVISNAPATSTRVLPASVARSAAIASAGSADRLARVSLAGLPSALRNERRSRCRS